MLKKLKFSHRLRYGSFQVIDKLLGRQRGVELTYKRRVKLYKSIHAHLKSTGKGEMRQVERIQGISIEDFKNNYIKKGIPVVIENGAKEWGCVKDWSIDYFNEKHGDDDITIIASNIGEAPFEITKLRDLLDNVNNGGDKYFRFYPLLMYHPEHIEDFDYKWLRACRNKFGFWEQFQVFIGGDKTYTPIHSAMPSNIFIQAYGEKEWVIYPPDLTAIIDCEPGKNFHRGAPHKKESGPFNPFNPDYESPYNLYELIDRYTTVLKPGDILYNPPQWWHAVQNNSVSIGVAYRWVSPIAALKSTFLYSFLDLLELPFNKEIRKNLGKDYTLIHICLLYTSDAADD